MFHFPHLPTKKTSHRKYFSFFLVIVLSATIIGTHFTYPVINESYQTSLLSKMEHAKNFEEFCNSLFCYEITSDTVTTAYTVENPAAYDIPSLIPDLTSFSYKSYQNSFQSSDYTNNLITRTLNSFDSSSLSDKEQLTYNLLKNTLSLNSKLNNYPYYSELLGSSTGIQASLPITLGEYPLHSKNDIQTYFQLIKQVPDYFNDVIEYENERESLHLLSKECIYPGTFQSLSTILEGLKGEDNAFIDTFNERIQQIPELTKKQQNDYRNKNKHYVETYIIPAYESLYDYLAAKSPSKMTPDENTSYGLSNLPQGKDYYTLLVKQSTGSSKTPEELITLTENTLKDAIGNVVNTAMENPDLYTYYCNNEAKSYYENPQSILEALSLLMRTDYPALSTTPDYEIKNVSDSLATSSSPAFYMIPPIDNTRGETIYINPLFTNNENGNLFTTLAHEGFPGHLYQTVYFNNTNPNPIRQILNYPGFVEGWATYVELNSYQYMEYPSSMESLCKLYQGDTIISLAISSRIDLGVNYENWTLSDVKKFFENNGFNSYYANNLYTYVVESPANYLSYFIGCLEIQELKNEYQLMHKDTYSEKEFHKKLLETGPCDFDTLKKYILN
mgnify:FL=1